MSPKVLAALPALLLAAGCVEQPSPLAGGVGAGRYDAAGAVAAVETITEAFTDGGFEHGAVPTSGRAEMSGAVALSVGGAGEDSVGNLSQSYVGRMDLSVGFSDGSVEGRAGDFGKYAFARDAAAEITGAAYLGEVEGELLLAGDYDRRTAGIDGFVSGELVDGSELHLIDGTFFGGVGLYEGRTSAIGYIDATDAITADPVTGVFTTFRH